MTQFFINQILYFEKRYISWYTVPQEAQCHGKRLPPPSLTYFAFVLHFFSLIPDSLDGVTAFLLVKFFILNKIIFLGTLCFKKHNVTVSVFLLLLLPTFPPHVTALQKHSLVPLGRNYVLAS